MLRLFDNVDSLWQNFLATAKIYVESNEVYSSPSEASTYRIESVRNNVLHLKRIEAGTTETIGKQKFLTAIERIKNKLPEIPKGGIYDHVIEETTLVMLLPMLDWSDDGKTITLLQDGYDQNISVTANESEQDYLNEKRLRLLRVRRGQNKFRFNLLRIYDGTCVISKCEVEPVLHACHVSPYSQTEDNRPTNGILLRADLHELYDLNLIAIHPETYIVHISPTLRGTQYVEFENVKIVPRRDGKALNPLGLKERWTIFKK